MSVQIHLEGQTGKLKSTTAATGRGRLAVIDLDNQFWISMAFPWASPVAELTEPWEGLAKGAPAVWHTTDPEKISPDGVRGFVKAAGIGAGDTLIIDPISELFSQIMDAYNAQPGVKGAERVNWFVVKRPYKRLLVALRNLPCDVIVTSRLAPDYDQAGNVTGLLRVEGEKQKTPYEFPFAFRGEVSSGPVYTLTCMKAKGPWGINYGDTFTGSPDSPILLRELFESRGVYAALDALLPHGGATMDPVSSADRAVGMFADVSQSAADLLEEVELTMRLKASLGRAELEALNSDREFLTKIAGMGPAERAKIKTLGGQLRKVAK